MREGERETKKGREHGEVAREEARETKGRSEREERDSKQKGGGGEKTTPGLAYEQRKEIHPSSKCDNSMMISMPRSSPSASM